MEIKSGIIIKGIGGFYYVKCDGNTIECRARGNFRKKSILPYVGDCVSINIENTLGYVTQILDRKNFFVRPPIANVNVLIIVSSVSNPAPDTGFIDKMLINALSNDVYPVICFNKCDIDSDVCEIMDSYKKAGFKVFSTSTVTKSGIDELKDFIYESKGIVSVCGFSGVGKSSLLNEIIGANTFETGVISERLNRGKHTTRHVELIELKEDLYIADTPGFSSISIAPDFDYSCLDSYYPDFSDYIPDCKYRDCNHTTEKHCGIYDAVQRGDISQFRYENYKTLYHTLKNYKEW